MTTTSATQHDVTATAARALRYDALLGSLAGRVVDRAAGMSIPTRTRLPDAPQSRLWLGMLASEPKLIADAQAGYTYGERLVPPAQGFTFRVASLPETLTFTVRAACYVALHPTLAEQQAAVTAGADAAIVAPTTTSTVTVAPAASRLAAVWTKVRMEPVVIAVTVEPGTSGTLRIGEAKLASALRSSIRTPTGSTLFRPRRQTKPQGSLPRDDDMLDDVSWERYCAANLTDADDVLAPEFRAAIELEISPGNGFVEVLAAVVNTTPPPDAQTFDGVHTYDAGYLNPQLYEVTLTADTDADLVPYSLEQVAQSYRYDRTVEALGHACAVKVTPRSGGVHLETLFAAEQATSRVYPRTEYLRSDGTGVPIETDFAMLIADPVAAVTRLVDAQRGWVEDNWGPTALEALAAERAWNEQARADAAKDAALAWAEVEWVAAGLELLRNDPDVQAAFVLANRAAQNAAAGRYTSWHPFQIAWIVGCLPGMADPANHQTVDIVWFATGGGKSEAYLGLMLTTLFYGRLTGVTAGPQVWARFPLRLLALQQTERIASMVLHAELVRRGSPRIAVGDPFGIGYFVGGGNTPNQLQRPDPTNPYYRGLDPTDPSTAEACRVLDNCPICGQRPEMSFDEPTWTMRHICRTAGCGIAGVLPVWGIDDEIYRHAPAVLVGTVDKLALLGLKSAFQILLGQVNSRCPQHGYTSNPSWCAVFGCKQTRQPVPAGFGHIRLEIADELHLLDESLGALDGMYETLLQAISESLGNAPMQIVGATATIEGYEKQVDHLYRRAARRFPVNGPTVGETFWSTTVEADPLRRYLGVRPRAITMVTATREVALAHAAWVHDLVHDPAVVLAEAGLDATESHLLTEAREAGADLFEVLVAYCLRNEDLTSFTRDAQIRELLDSHDNLAIINSDAGPGDVRRAVARLTKPPSDPDDRVKMIAATKAIGHGFDVARLGVMAVMGTPTQAAEIIQASARVGRRWPGLVVNIINPTRDRDASVFRYYADWIRFLDRLVHKVPVNRESLPVLRRVLSGGLMAWLLQVHDRRWLTGGPRRKSLADSIAFRDATQAGVIDRALLIDDLSRGFGIDPTTVYHQLHRDAITAWAEDQLATLPLRAEGHRRLPDLLAPPVPRSLRDIEDPIVIYGDI